MTTKNQTTQPLATVDKAVDGPVDGVAAADTQPNAAMSLPAKTNPNQQQVELAPKVTSLIARVTRSRPGQPTKRTADVVEEMLDRIARGETLVAVCQDDHMPGYSTVQQWCKGDKELLAAIDAAYEWHARVLDDIADDMLAGGPTSAGDFRRDEARVAHMRWRMGKLNRRFRDKQEIEQSIKVMTPQMPDWFFGQVVDGELSEDSDPTI